MSRVRRGCGLFFMGLIFILAGLFSLYLFGQVYTLDCERLEMENPDCVRESRWLGLVSLGQRSIEGLAGATVSESCDEDGCTYRVNLQTEQGEVALSGFYSSGREDKERLAQRINDYVSEPEVKTLQVETERSLLVVALTSVFIVVGVVIMISAPISLLRPG